MKGFGYGEAKINIAALWAITDIVNGEWRAVSYSEW